MNLPPVKRKLISRRNFDRIYPLLFSTLGLVAFTLVPKDTFIQSLTCKFISPDFLNTYITVEATLFGFLLTVLSIILQMNNKGIETLKRIGRYNELISFGKTAVLSALFLLILSILIILLRGDFEPKVTLRILYHIIGFTAIFNVFSTLRFTNVFFVLLKLNGS